MDRLTEVPPNPESVPETPRYDGQGNPVPEDAERLGLNEPEPEPEPEPELPEPPKTRSRAKKS
jgi:hypothetical protein